MSTSDLYRRTATEVVGLLQRGEVTPLELIDVAADRIAATDGAINAMPTLCLERARDHAKRLMASGERTLLGGLPIAVKDLNEVEGVRCTHGSPIFADHIPARSDLMVEALEARGAIVVGKRVGFGKEIAGFTDRRGTRWKLSALPLGGYVQFKGDAHAEYMQWPRTWIGSSTRGALSPRGRRALLRC